MLFRKKRVEKNIVNDFDNDIVNLYVSVSEKFDEFINHIYWIPRSRKLFEVLPGRDIKQQKVR